MSVKLQATKNLNIPLKDGVISFALKLLLVITVFCAFLPLMPVLPSAEPLDPSWTIGINQAVAQGLRFGKDIIFTLEMFKTL